MRTTTNTSIASAIVHISERCGQGKQALLETAVEAFPGLFAKVADVVGVDHCLNVGGKPSAPRLNVQTGLDEAHIDALIDEFTEICPVPEIPCSAVNLVDDDASGVAGFEKGNEVGENRPAFGCGSDAFLKPPADTKVAFCGKFSNCRFLLLEGDSPLSLSFRGDARVRRI